MSARIRLRVVDIIDETEDARSITFEAVDGPQPIPYRPGQFLTFRVPDGESHLARCYSLCSSPAESLDRLTVTVKRIPGGRGSAWLCDALTVGDEVEALKPTGRFTPATLDQDLLLVAAGSGVTPVMSILSSALQRAHHHVTVFYANRDERSVIFAGRLAALEREYPDRLTVLHWLESVQGVPDPGLLAGRLAPYADREAYVCGPAPFMVAVSKALMALDVPTSRVHTEEFVSLRDNPFAAPDPIEIDSAEETADLEVTIDGQTFSLGWPVSRSLTDVLLAAGLDAPYSCREGACSACACAVLEGVVEMEHNEVLDESDVADGIVLGCQARPRTPSVRISYDA